MFYEGSEKKAEIIIDSKQLSLLDDVKDDFWTQMVQRCGAAILSKVHNDHCKAFLLSESSLFVWQDRLLLITCGQTRLVHGVEFFINHIKRHQLLQINYQRKNEYFANAQSSSFVDDTRLLNQTLSGVAYRFGELYGHHNYLYHLDNDYQAHEEDKTCELLAYQISQSASEHLTAPNLSAQAIREFLQVEKLVPGFTLHDHVFKPFGYSLNAIKGDRYLTIHVTPQATSSYVSFDTNIDLMDKIPLLLEILSPACFDLVSFNDPHFDEKVAAANHYVSKSLVCEKLDNGLDVRFASFIRPQQHFAQPARLDLDAAYPVF